MAFLLILGASFVFHPAWGQGRLVISNITVIDGTDHPPRVHSTVVVQGKKIVSISGEGAKPLEGATVVDGTGKFLIPGLWNNDLHGPAYGEAKPQLSGLVAYGITTVRDMGASLEDILRLREATASGALVGPRLFIAGPLMEGPVPIQMSLIVDLFSEGQARDEVRTLKLHNVDYVEVDTTLTPELYWAIADEAKREGLPLVGHIPAKIAAGDIVNANQKNVEHLGGRFFNVLVACSSDEAYFNQVIAKTYDELLIAVKENRQINEPQFRADFDDRLLRTFDDSKAQRLYRLYAQKGVVQTPTLYVLNTLWQSNKDSDKLNDEDMDAGKKIFAKDLEVVGKMKRAGVTILAGTDGPYSQGGDALHSELELLVQAGLSPLQALQAASRDAAQAMGVSNEVGTIEAGKVADMVMLEADPIKSISNTRRIAGVILQGHMFTKEELSAMAAR
ncbi:amidohydrolase family protein [Acidicapsa ligni]|uniref:amidohydrolase family protein n=1 Tax=Acidicapsa ligni TaxID=542300 RepID=UPI0021E00097|nr:amidohydrolase family protein [Acidicapsa ligni]